MLPRVSLALKDDEKLGDGVRRIIGERVDRALEALKSIDPSRRARRARRTTPAEAVHTARRRLKEARAAVRLVRDALGRKTFDEANAVLRDAARPLSAVRDAQVL